MDTLRIERVVDAPVERVFAAWVNPRMLARWAWGRLGVDVRAEVDFRVGGRYRVGTRRSSGEEWAFDGVFTEIVPNHKLVYTICWKAPMGYESDHEQIAIAFEADGDRTKIVFTHVGVPDAASREKHRIGWEDCLDVLDETLTGE